MSILDSLFIPLRHRFRRSRFIVWPAFDYIQPFYVDADAVSGATSAMVTSIDLYFKGKPNKVKNISGYDAPGVTVSICEIVNDTPNMERVLADSVQTLDYDDINASTNGQARTTISYNSPVRLETGRSYGLVVKFHDPAYLLWENVQGHRLLSLGGLTNRISPGSMARYFAHLYRGNNISLFNPHFTRVIKFKINIAKFNTSNTSGTANSYTFTLVNKPYEFFTVNNVSGYFYGGEWVYKSSVSNEAGTLTISSGSNEVYGNGTNFTNSHLGKYAVVSNGSAIDVLEVVAVTNTTHMKVDKFPEFNSNSATYKIPPIGKVHFTDYTQNTVVLVDSNAANATFRFETGDTLAGHMSNATATVQSINRHKIDKFTPRFVVGNPSTTNFNIRYALTTDANTIANTTGGVQLGEVNNLPYEGYILSRSQEVVESGLYGNDHHSAYMSVNFNVTTGGANNYNVPFIDQAELDFGISTYDINSNTYATVNGVDDYDTEVDRNGLGKSKHITIKVPFGEARLAEDVLVFLTGVRPPNTEIKVYAKIHNAADKEAFDDKAWSPLELKTNVDKYSDASNNLIEYSYGLPQHPPVDLELTGTFTCQNGNAVITTTVDHSSNVSSGDLLKLSSPLFPENHEVFVVSSANTSAIVLTRKVQNNNIAGEVNVDKLKYRHVAWNNIANDNVARYVTESKVEFDGYNTMQFKVVFLSDRTNIVPRIEQFQAIGASA